MLLWGQWDHSAIWTVFNCASKKYPYLSSALNFWPLHTDNCEEMKAPTATRSLEASVKLKTNRSTHLIDVHVFSHKQPPSNRRGQSSINPFTYKRRMSTQSHGVWSPTVLVPIPSLANPGGWEISPHCKDFQISLPMLCMYSTKYTVWYHRFTTETQSVPSFSSKLNPKFFTGEH